MAERAPGGEFAAAARVASVTRPDRRPCPRSRARRRRRARRLDRDLRRHDGGAHPGRAGTLRGARHARRPRAVPARPDSTGVRASSTRSAVSGADEVRVRRRVPGRRRREHPRATYAPDGRALVTWARNPPTRRAVVADAVRGDVIAAERRARSAAGCRTPARSRRSCSRTGGRRSRGPLTGPRIAAASTLPWRARPTLGSDRRRACGCASGAPSTRRTVRLRVTCSAACDVRAQLARDPDSVETLALPRAGTDELEIEPTSRPRRFRVLLRHGAPGARRVTARTLTLRR